MKAIIYCRKSTDRSDRQQLSISSQEAEARRIAEREGLEVVQVFRETMSAKEPGRPLFNQMMAMFSSWKADCIITWKLNRIARNPIDEWTIKWSIQNWLIKAIYTEWEVFKTWDNVLIMWMHFWMSTQYILDLQRDIKRGRRKKIENWWVCQKAPLWYKNNKLEKTIEVDPVKSEWVKLIFELRAKWLAFREISKILYEKWITKTNWEAFPNSTLETLARNKFYIWLVKIKWNYYKRDYPLFISNKLFNQVNQEKIKWVYETSDSWIKYPLKWFIKDSSWILLTWYRKWNMTYYKSSIRSDVIVNINERQIFDKIGEELKNYQMDEKFKEFNKEFALDLLEKWIIKKDDSKNIEKELRNLEFKKSNLLELRLDWDIDKKTYDIKFNEIINKINSLNDEKSKINNRKDKEKILKTIELACSLYESYKQGNDTYKTDSIRKLTIELSIDNKKELTIAENSLLKLVKFVNSCYGGA